MNYGCALFSRMISQSGWKSNIIWHQTPHESLGVSRGIERYYSWQDLMWLENPVMDQLVSYPWDRQRVFCFTFSYWPTHGDDDDFFLSDPFNSFFMIVLQHHDVDDEDLLVLNWLFSFLILSSFIPLFRFFNFSSLLFFPFFFFFFPFYSLLDQDLLQLLLLPILMTTMMIIVMLKVIKISWEEWERIRFSSGPISFWLHDSSSRSDQVKERPSAAWSSSNAASLFCRMYPDLMIIHVIHQTTSVHLLEYPSHSCLLTEKSKRKLIMMMMHWLTDTRVKLRESWFGWSSSGLSWGSGPHQYWREENSYKFSSISSLTG